MLHLLPDFLAYLGLGMFAGIMSGMMGAGGGLVTVPGLVFVFQLQAFPPSLIMHVAVGTTLAKMMVVASRSLLAHMKRNIQFFYLYKKMVPGLVAGVIGGSIVAHFMYSSVLKMAFGCFVVYLAVKLFLKNGSTKAHKPLPGRKGLLLAGSFVGIQSGLFGIGGSAFTVPYLTNRGVSIRVAVIVSVSFAVTVAALGALTFIVVGYHAPGLPHWSTGYIYWPAWCGLVLGGVVMAPIGAKWSHALPPEKLERFFAVFLAIVGLHMLWSA